MPIGLDTGFFFILPESEEAQRVWMEEELVTSAVVLYEIQRKLLKGDFPEWKAVIDDIERAVEVIPLTPFTALKAAHLAHGIGIHGFDALIMATFIEVGCKEIYTLDEHFLSYRRSGVKIHLLTAP